MSLSLQGSVRTCKVDQGWANKVQSDRFENPNLLVCPIWDGMDQYGRYVNPDSFYTKAPGCSSAEDRVYVENDQRPKYFEYVTLDAAGIQGTDYMTTFGSAIQRKALDDIGMVTGRVGLQNQANVKVSCPYNAYNDAQAQLNRLQRGLDMDRATYLAAQNQRNSGMY